MKDLLTIVARIVPGPGFEDRLEANMRLLVEATRKEAGCVQYDLHRTTEGPCIFLFYETWESKPHWEAHMEGPALSDFGRRAEGMIQSREILQMSKLA